MHPPTSIHTHPPTPTPTHTHTHTHPHTHRRIMYTNMQTTQRETLQQTISAGTLCLSTSLEHVSRRGRTTRATFSPTYTHTYIQYIHTYTQNIHAFSTYICIKIQDQKKACTSVARIEPRVAMTSST